MRAIIFPEEVAAVIRDARRVVERGGHLGPMQSRHLVECAEHLQRQSTHAAQDYEHQGDDRQDDQDRVEHDRDSTPPTYDLLRHNKAVSGETYRVVTPEIRAVLDALPAWEQQFSGTHATPDATNALLDVGRAYLASIEPPQPMADDIANMILNGDNEQEVRDLLQGRPALAIDVVISLTDKAGRADQVFKYANRVIEILDRQ